MSFRPQPAVDFSLSPASGSRPLVVDFAAAAEGTPATYLWNFGDGSTSSEQAPSHVYYTKGTYTVTLTVSYSSGETVTAKKTDCIEVGGGFTSPTSLDLYWLNGSTHTIRRGPAAGGAVATLVSGGARGEALAVGLGRVYWWDGNDLVRTPTGGGSPAYLFYTYGAPLGLCVDEAHSKLYWTSQTFGRAGGILRCDPGGGNIQFLLSEPNDRHARFVAFDPVTNRLYYLEMHYDYSVQPHAASDAKAVTVTASISWINPDTQATHSITSGLSQSVGGLAIDAGLSAGARYIYWTKPAAGTIERCKIDGTDRTTLIAGLSSPQGIAVDITSGYLYWSDASGIHRSKLDGTGKELIYPNARAVALAIGQAP
jgi:PKD repeat protein